MSVGTKVLVGKAGKNWGKRMSCCTASDVVCDLGPDYRENSVPILVVMALQVICISGVKGVKGSKQQY